MRLPTPGDPLLTEAFRQIQAEDEKNVKRDRDTEFSADVSLYAAFLDRGGNWHNVSAYGDTSNKAGAVQGAITAASANGDRTVYVPKPFFGYDASSVTFDNSVKMVAEGGNPAHFDVRAYGAVGDGSNDDGGALQAAIEQAKGGRVWLPNTRKVGGRRAIYNTSQQLDISVSSPNNDGIVIEGEGRWDAVTIQNTGTGDCININDGGLKYVKIANLRVRGSNDSDQGIVWEGNIEHLVFDSVRISNCSGNGFLYRGTSHMNEVTFYDCHVSNCGSHGFFLGRDGATLNHALLLNCLSSQNGGRGFSLDPGSTGNIEATLIMCSADENTGDAYRVADRVTLIRCDCEDNAKGVHVSGTGEIEVLGFSAFSQPDAIDVAAAADTYILHPQVGGTPVGEASAVYRAAATGFNFLREPDFDSTFTINASAVLHIEDDGVSKYHNQGWGTGTDDPTADAPTDWIEVEVGGATRYIPLYT